MYMKTSEYQQLKVLQHKKNVSIIHAKKNDLHVIIKRFHTSILQPNDRQWEKEIEIMRTINHPSVPRLLHTYDDFIDNKRLPHLIIEYIHGESLKKILKQKKLSEQQIVNIIQKLLLLLHYLASLKRPILHLNIIPSNIIIEPTGNPLLIGFDLSIFSDEVDLLAYPKEKDLFHRWIFIEEDIHQIDLYCVAIIAIQCLSGMSILNLINQHNQFDLTLVQSKIPEHWYQWLECILGHNKTKRYTSPQEALLHMTWVNLKQIEQLLQSEKEHATYSLIQFNNTKNSSFIESFTEHKNKYQQEQIQERQNIQSNIFEDLQEQERRLLKQQKQGSLLKEKHNTVADEISTNWLYVLTAIKEKTMPQKEALKFFVCEYQDKIVQEIDGRDVYFFSPEYEIARNFPKIPQNVVDAYLQKIDLKIQKQIDYSTEIQQKLDEEAIWISTITDLETELQNLYYWQKLIYKEDEKINTKLDESKLYLEEIQSEISTLRQKEIEDREALHKIHLLDWTVLPSERYIPTGKYVLQSLRHLETIFQKSPLYVMTTVVTQKLWQKVMHTNPSIVKGDNLPVQVNWLEGVIFANKLSKTFGFEKAYNIPSHINIEIASKNGDEYSNAIRQITVKWDSNGYRLPTFVEWEYFAQAGEDYRFAGSNDIQEIGWTQDNTNQIKEVGLKKSNAWGLYDVSGNVSEWCWDLLETNKDMSKTNQIGKSDSTYRSLRGGNWKRPTRNAYIKNATKGSFYRRQAYFGFRLVRTAM